MRTYVFCVLLLALSGETWARVCTNYTRPANKEGIVAETSGNTGTTVINSGFKGCIKPPSGEAVQGDVKVLSTTLGLESGIWFGANGPLIRSSVLTNETANAKAGFALHGTQPRHFIPASHADAFFENNHPEGELKISGIDMVAAGLTCDNCTFGATTGTPGSPAVILASPGTFAGGITLNGSCNFTITGTGDYHLSGVISGTGPLTYNAPNAGSSGLSAGVTLDGSNANSYTGRTTITGGYVICNKPNGVLAIPSAPENIIKISATSASVLAQIWCLRDNQLGTSAIIDFSDAQSSSYINLNGTTQTIAGLKSNNGNAVVENNWDNSFLPAGMTAAQLSTNAATLNIAAGSTCIFGEGGYIRKGHATSPALTVTITSGAQVIQNPTGNINNVTLASAPGATLEFNSTTPGTYSFGGGVTFSGAGTIKKTGLGPVTTNNSTVLKPSGLIWVYDGIFRNDVPPNTYSSNIATLQVEALNGNNTNPIFDLWGCNSIFGGLTGGGIVQNNWGLSGSPQGGYNDFILGQNSPPVNPVFFNGVIRDNATNASVSTGGFGRGGISLRQQGVGTQVLTGDNRYTGTTTVSSGTLKLQGNGQLGNTTAAGIYNGVLEIANVSTTTQALFEHNGNATQVFNGDITNTGSGTLGTYIQSGSGKTIFNGVKNFSGDVLVFGGLLGGPGDISKVNRVRVDAGASIGGGDGNIGGGATLTVANLTFSSSGSKLLVTSRPDNTPGVVDVKVRATTTQGTLSASAGFIVDVAGGTNLVSGYIIYCTNGVSGSLPLPTLGANNTGKSVCFKWDATGLYMNVIAMVFDQPADITIYRGQFQPAIPFTTSGTGNTAPTGYQWKQKGAYADNVGLADYTADWTKTAIPAFTAATTSTLLRRSIEVTAINSSTGCTTAKTFTYTVSPKSLMCDNCTFMSGSTSITGTTGSPAVILASPGTFAGGITLNGPCNFTITGTGDYLLSGVISGTGPLTYKTSDAGWAGHNAGVTLGGSNANTYTGLTTIAGGYIVCSKPNGVAAVPGNSKVSATAANLPVEVWCRANNQLGNGVIDFSGAQSYSFIRLNGTTQTVAGLQANNSNAMVENNWDNASFPAGMTAAQISTSPATLNIAAGSAYTFGGGGYIRRGSGTAPALTVNVTGGIQIIQNPTGNINNVTLSSDQGATLELNSSNGSTYSFGDGVTFRGAGTIKKSGAGPVTTHVSTILKSGLIWVYDGIFRNDMGNNVYSTTTPPEINTATLQVDAPNGFWDNHSPTFDLWGNNSIFGGLTGGGYVQNNFGDASSGALPGGGYNEFTLGQNNNYAVFDGVIRDNSGNAPASPTGAGNGGITLKKTGTGVQVLTGGNRYTGTTTVTSGTLQLQGNGQLGNAGATGTYNGVLEISNSTSQAIFEHNGVQTQVFTGNITNTGSGNPGLFIQSGNGKSIINGTVVKDFTGDISITAGFLGGSGNLSKAGNLYVGASGSIGGGYGVDDNGATLTIASLNFLAANSKLIVTSTSASDATPSLLDVKNGSGVQGPISAAFGFKVDVVADNLSSGYVIKCTNGLSSNFSLPTLGVNNTGKPVAFKWDNTGLYMSVGVGLSCDNCTFTSGSTTMTGTTASPAFILVSPGTFTGGITLNGACNFNIRGTGDYRLSGVISGSGPLTCKAPDAGVQGHSAGITLEGTNANTYSGQTIITGGYVICNKPNGVAAIPAAPGTFIKISATAAGVPAHLWCQKDNQLGTGAIIDFSDAQNFSYIDLNGTTQNTAGLQANNSNAVVENNWDNTFFPAGLTAAQLSTNPATLNIAAGSTTCTFGGGGYIRKGTTNSPALTVNLTVGTQIIQNPTGNINNVTLASAQGTRYEFYNSTANTTYSFGDGITFRGAGTIKKTGTALITTNNSTILLSGLIWVYDGVFRNENDYNLYSSGTESNTATLQVDGPSGTWDNHSPTFDIWGNNSIFDGLTGGGWVQNGWGSVVVPSGGYSWLTLGQNNSQGNPIFDGVIRDNPTNGPVSANGFGTGGITLRKVGIGIQVLKGDNRYTGTTTVSLGTLQLQGNGQLGNASAAGTYNGVLEISNSATQAIFEHNGVQTQVFTGNITNTGSGNPGLFIQSGNGKTIISGAAKDFTGDINITGGFLGGSGNISKAGNLRVAAGGSIGGGYGVDDNGATLTIAGLNFLAPASKLIVTSISGADSSPSLLDVKASGTANPGPVSAASGFTVDIVGGNNQLSGYVIKCSNGLSSSLPLPALGINSTGKTVAFKWDNTGLYMGVGDGLICDNCTFTSGSTTVTGTTGNPALILGFPGTFANDITLNGPCNFAITGTSTGNYSLSGVIRGSGPLTYSALNAGFSGLSAGITLEGTNANTYSGQTTITSGYVICNKPNGVAAIPSAPGAVIRISATSAGVQAQLWCRTNNQLGTGAIIDFSDAQSNSYINLNGTTQNTAGLQANNSNAVVENHWDNTYFPAGMTAAQLSTNPAIVNIAAGSTTCTFGGGGYIRKGTDSPTLTLNLTVGAQVIQNPTGNINNVILASAQGTRYEFYNSTGSTYSFGDGVTFRGAGTIKKIGTGTVTTNNSTILSSGLIWVYDGVFRNDNDYNLYSNSTESNTATLQVDAPSGSWDNHSPTFDIWGNNSIFDGLTGGGWVQNGWGSVVVPSGGYSWLTLGQNNSQGNPIFDGVIRDNPTNGPVSANGLGTGGLSLRKVGTGIQVLKGDNRYTGTTTVSSGTLQLQGNGQLGNASAAGTYNGVLEISNSATQAIFEHNGVQTQVFTGNITNTGSGNPGLFIQSGNGKTIISGAAKDFTGDINITGGFLGGSGNLSKAGNLRVAAGGSIGGGYGVDDNGATLTITGLNFLAPASKLIVTSISGADSSPSLLDVKASGTGNPGPVSAANGFTVDIVGGNNQLSGYVIKCSNGLSSSLPLPALGINSTGKTVAFKWDNTGLYMGVGDGLICDNCTFTSGSTTVTGTTGNPALILGFPGTFANDITLNGPCNFTITGTSTGNYSLSGVIRGSGPLTYKALNAGTQGYSTGITLEGTGANTYSGQTNITSGYVICNKPNGVAAIPAAPGTTIKISAASAGVPAHLWCRTNNQLGTGAIIDFSDAQSNSFIHLNGTTQNTAGLQANNSNAGVENNWDNTSLPAGLTAAQLSTNPATLNIAAGSTACNFAGGGYIRKGTTNSPSLTVNLTVGTQVIQNPTGNINNVTLASSQGTRYEFYNSTDNTTYSFGDGVTFRVAGTIEKTGTALITTNNSTILSSGMIWVYDGVFRNENDYNLYSNGTESNTATLRVDAPAGWDNHNPTFDIWGNNSIFDALIGGGWVQNGWGSVVVPSGGYSWLTLGQNNSLGTPIFDGVIRDNPTNGPVSANGFGTGGITLRKVGTGIQVLKGDNRYTGTTTVSLGTLQLQGNGQLGNASAAGTYNGVLEISNSATQAIFEHNGVQTQVFTGNITNTGSGNPGLFIQSGNGKTIISGAAKDFTGDINITGGFLGGSGNISKAGNLRVAAGGSIGGGYGVDDNGATLTIAGLNFLAPASKLIVTSISGADSSPSLLDVKASGTGNPGPISAANGFTVDIVGGNNQLSGYVIKCTNGLSSSLPLPALGINSTGKTVAFKWDNIGLYMGVGEGLTCDNCTFTSGSTTVTGTTGNPALILGFPGTFTNNITLNGSCNFTITGTSTGNYSLSGVISGTGPLTYRALNAGTQGHSTGITLEGTGANTYSGQTTITGGYVICNKPNGVAAIPSASGTTIKISAASAGVLAHLWCRTNNQLGTGAIIDFSDAQSNSFIHLNGTTQNTAGLQANNSNAGVENNWDNTSLPAGLTAAQLSTNPATLNIAAGSTACNFAGGGYIRKGTTNSPSLTVNLTVGTQVIQNPTGNINNVTLASAQGTRYEFYNSTDNTTYSFGDGVTFRGAGTIKKTGTALITTNNSTILSSGLIWVYDGVFRNENDYNLYSNGTESNTATLQVDAPVSGNHNPTFDIWGNNSIFDGLTGGGWVQNGWGSVVVPSGGYSWLTLGQNNSQGTPIFDGVIRDNPTNGPVSANGFGTGGIALKKVGTGTQVLKGDNRYTGTTTVSSGTLQLQGNGQLGNASAAGTYNGVLEISNSATQAIFEHNGVQTQVFTGNITNTGSGNPGLFIQSGNGKTIISGAAKDFTGDINITGGFLGGSGNISKAGNLRVAAGGSIGGGYGVDDNGAALTIAGLNFLAPSSKLIVTSASATDGTPSLLDVKASGTGNPGPVSAANGFTVDIVGGNNQASGYVIKCTNGLSSSLPLPAPGLNNTGKTVSFRWDNMGLYMVVGEGLTCDNCTFISGSTTMTGTPASPALILSSPGTFASGITLNGPCNFTITGAGTGNYTLSGVISGTGPLTYNAPNAGTQGLSAGFTLDGANANTYTGQTTIVNGYIICNKPNGIAAVPGTIIKIAAASAGIYAHLWCLGDNQLGAGAIIDFSDAQSNSFIHLNGTTQTVIGLQANNGSAVVENNRDNTFLPAGMNASQLSTNPATLNIAAGSTTYTFGGGGYIRKGTTNSPALTVTIIGGTQIIQNPTANINNVTLASTQGATLEFNSTNANTYSLGRGVTFSGAGTIKKSGAGPVTTNNSTLLKSGLIWVYDGVFRNDNDNNVYSAGGLTNTATLQVDVPDPGGNNHNPTFDLYGNACTFDGLTGGGWVQNNWGSSTPLPGDGYAWLTLGQNNSQNNPVFDGVIRDNLNNDPVDALGGAGKGGVALQKVGSGTQGLSGNNTYTGSTSVIAGTLKLQGNGVLGGGNYANVLDISNVITGTPAIFEHNGTQTQIFSDNISSSNSGTLGTFLQSGDGKTIMNGVKNFTGNVTITRGFLGGAGDLSRTNSMTVGANGSIGGGNGVDDNGATLTVSGLNFLTTASKLIVTSISATDGTPGLLNVKTRGSSSPGPIAAANGFTVDAAGGTNLVSGYILKCTNGLSSSLPLPTLGSNNTGAGVCFKWDNTGLWMQIVYGNITLTSNSVCPKGASPGNPAITITATFSDPRDYPLPGAVIDFSLSDLSVKNGAIATTRVDNVTITGVFDGVNQTTANKPYTVTYNDHQNCIATLATTINPQPTLGINSGGNPTCKGTPMVLQATGNGPLTISSTNTNIATVVNNTPSVGSATATTLAAGNVNFLAVDTNGCNSEHLPVLVKDLPVMDEIPDLSVCNAVLVPAYTPSSSGVGETKPTHYQWKAEANAVNSGNVGLSDYTADWSKTAINGFTATNTATALKRDVTVSAYNSTSGCTSVSQVYTITVNPNPVITANRDLSKLCSGAPYADALVGGAGSWAVYETGTTVTGRSTVTNSAAAGHADIQAGAVTVTTLEDVVFTSATSCQSRLTITIHPKPVMDEIPDFSVCSNALIAAYTPPSSGAGETRPTHYQWKMEANAVNSDNVGLSDYTSDWSKTAISGFTAANTTTPLKRDVTVSAYNSTSGCTSASQVYTITVNSGLMMTYTATSPICNGVETDIALSSTLSQTTYTWTVNNNNVGAQSQTTPSSTTSIRQTLTDNRDASGTAARTSPETVTYTVTGVSGGCSGTASIPVEVSSANPVTPTLTGGGHYCVNPQNGTYQTHLTLSTIETNVEWIYSSYYGTGQPATAITGNTQQAGRGALTAVNDNLVLSNTPSASVYYVFRPYYNGCFGNPAAPIGIRLYAAPVATAVTTPAVCSNSEGYPTAANIVLSTSTPDVVYTWTVDRANGPDVIGYSQPSREGARVPTQNPSEARSGPIADALSLPVSADTQTIDYWITPWHLGCPGQAVQGTVRVNPLPVITAPADREHCAGNSATAPAEALSGTRGVNAFTWTGGAQAGLADQTVYGPGLPSYRVASTTTPLALKVTISGKNDNGCKASTTFNITVNPKPSITLGNSQILCTGPTIETAAQTDIEVSTPIAGTKYKWTASFVDFRSDGKSNVKIVDGNNGLLTLPVPDSPKENGNFTKKITATTDSYGQITFRLTPFLGNCAGDSKDTDVTVKGADLLSDISNNSPDVFCGGATTNIKVGKEGDGNTYNWLGINNSHSVLGYTSSNSWGGATTIRDVLTVENNGHGNITYRITTRRHVIAQPANYDCTGASVSYTIAINPTPVLSLSPVTASICSGEQTAITASINLTPPESNNVYYSWEVSLNTVGAQPSSGFQTGMPQQTLTNDNASEESVTYIITPWYQPDAASRCAGQPVTSTYQVGSRVKVSINGTTPEAVCLGDKVTLEASIKGANSQWLKDGEAILGATGDSYTVPTDNTSASSYAVTITNGCGSITSEERKVQVSPEAYFTGSVSMDKTAAAMGEAVKFSYTYTPSDNAPKVDYLWDFNDNTLTSNTESATHSYAKPGIYYPTLKVTKPGQAVCTKTFSFSLEIKGSDPNSSAEYDVFPIPARDRLTINSKDDLQSITLSDMTGKMILNEAVKGHNVSVSVAHIAPGIYLLTITASNGVKRLEISKE